MKYSDFLTVLYAHAEESFAVFQSKLIFTNQKIIGVRTPALRKIAKTYQNAFADIWGFPDEFYEVTFIKLAMVAKMPYQEFIQYVDCCVMKMDNWATCDTFKADCIQQNRDRFLPHLENLWQHNGEYFQRYVLVTLLYAYIKPNYYSILEKYIQSANTSLYYVHMAVAWLTAEILVKDYDYGISLLEKELVDRKTHNKAIQKAIESYRLSQAQKERLRSLKINTKR